MWKSDVLRFVYAEQALPLQKPEDSSPTAAATLIRAPIFAVFSRL